MEAVRVNGKWCEVVGAVAVAFAALLLLGLAMAASAWLGDLVAGL